MAMFDILAAQKERGITPLKYTQLLKQFPKVAEHPEWIFQVSDYAEARGLDVFSGHVHADTVNSYIANASVPVLRIMPTIHGYRHIAHASGQFGGKDAPVYGPTSRFTFPDSQGRQVLVDAPDWIEMTVYKIEQGIRCPVTHREFFIENVATNSYSGINPIWKKRPAGMLAKCVEAQVLRSAFSNCDGYTADEMHGVDEHQDNSPALPANEKVGSSSLIVEFREAYSKCSNAQELTKVSEKIESKRSHIDADGMQELIASYQAAYARITSASAAIH
jgi:hypothetical protein